MVTSCRRRTLLLTETRANQSLGQIVLHRWRLQLHCTRLLSQHVCSMAYLCLISRLSVHRFEKKRGRWGMGGVSNKASRGSVGCERGETKTWPLNNAGVGLQTKQQRSRVHVRVRACMRVSGFFLRTVVDCVDDRRSLDPHNPYSSWRD